MKLESFHLAGVHYREEFIKCGKGTCKKCPHGPYWYAYSRKGAYLRKVYVGKFLPRQIRDHVPEHLRSLANFD